MEFVANKSDRGEVLVADFNASGVDSSINPCVHLQSLARGGGCDKVDSWRVNSPPLGAEILIPRLSREQPIHGAVQIVLRGVNGSMDTASSTAGKNTFSADSLKGMHCEAYRTDKMNVYCQNVR